MNRTIKSAGRIHGNLTVPGDKSISHRALMLGAISKGDITVSGLSSAADCLSTENCLRALGVDILRSGENALIKGRGLYGLAGSEAVLDAQNSGTTIRLMSGLLAGQSFKSIITGDSSLRNRPMKRIIDPLALMGASIHGESGDSRPPLTIIGKGLHAIEYTLPIASAQVKSAVLLAGLHCPGQTTVIEKMPSRDHTERLLSYLGANIHRNGNSITITASTLHGKNIQIPGDMSSAIFFIAAALLSADSRIVIINVGLNPTRTGAISILKAMGAQIEISDTNISGGEPYGDIIAVSSELHGIEIIPDNIPSLIDEIPILTLAATQAVGQTVIKGAGELRVKESDRLANIAFGLNAMGADISQTEDGLIINGPTPLTGTKVNSSLDHRMAMTFAIAGLIAKNHTVIENSECVAISFPDFFNELDALAFNREMEI